MDPWAAPSHWGDRREASSWMELLCFSHEGFDPFPFVPQITTCVARLRKGAGFLPELVIFSRPITMELESYDTYITTQQHNYPAVCVTAV